MLKFTEEQLQTIDFVMQKQYNQGWDAGVETCMKILQELHEQNKDHTNHYLFAIRQIEYAINAGSN